jgi:di/tricarboxylate transporter
MDWFAAASVPCIISILATPIIMYILDPPELKAGEPNCLMFYNSTNQPYL